MNDLKEIEGLHLFIQNMMHKFVERRMSVAVCPALCYLCPASLRLIYPPKSLQMKLGKRSPD